MEGVFSEGGQSYDLSCSHTMIWDIPRYDISCPTVTFFMTTLVHDCQRGKMRSPTLNKLLHPH